MKIIFYTLSFLCGTVCDTITNEPLTGVEVQVNGHTYYTDLDGKFKLSEDSVKTIELSFISYPDTTITL